MYWMPSWILLLGLLLFIVGGLMAMKGVINEDARSAPVGDHPVRMNFRRRLPRHGICPVGVTLVVVGLICVVGSYFLRL